MKYQYYIICYYHGSVHYCWLWLQEWKKFTKKDSVVKFSRVPKIVENEGEHGFQPEVAMTLRTIRLKMRGFVLGILCLAKLPNSGPQKSLSICCTIWLSVVSTIVIVYMCFGSICNWRKKLYIQMITFPEILDKMAAALAHIVHNGAQMI